MRKRHGTVVLVGEDRRAIAQSDHPTIWEAAVSLFRENLPPGDSFEDGVRSGRGSRRQHASWTGPSSSGLSKRGARCAEDPQGRDGR